MESKTLLINDVSTLVTISGEGQPLLCLHGWGKEVDHHAFDALREALKNDPIQIIVPDLPGFGESDEPSRPWSVDDYCDFVEELISCERLAVSGKQILLLGHSFGGRIAIKLAARQEKGCHPEQAPRSGARRRAEWLSRLYLCAAAGVGRDLLLKRKFWLGIAKIGNVFCSVPILKQLKPTARKLLYRLLRKRDYYDASEMMRKTMALTIEEDLTPCLEKITVPTDLFWGERDTLTPLRDGELMNKKIVQSSLHTYADSTHRVHKEQAEKIAARIRANL